ncbi:MAG: S1 RNA-binding domain-containing protein [Anaerolineae bacterium]
MTEPDAPSAKTTQDFAELWESIGDEYGTASPERGDILEGTIVQKGGGEILVDVGAKQEALVSSKDLSRMSHEELAELQLGVKVKVYVLRPQDRDGNLLVSINLAKAQEDWITAAELMENDETVTATIESFNKGGLVCKYRSLQGFIPMSQIANLARRTQGEPAPDGLEVFVGRELKVKIIEVNRRRPPPDPLRAGRPSRGTCQAARQAPGRDRRGRGAQGHCQQPARLWRLCGSWRYGRPHSYLGAVLVARGSSQGRPQHRR